MSLSEFLHRHPVWIGLAGMTLLCFNPAIDKNRLAAGQELRPELTIVPGDAFAYVHLRPADLAKTQIVSRLTWHYAGDLLNLPASPARSLLLDVANVESISVVFPTIATLESFMDGRPEFFEDNRATGRRHRHRELFPGFERFEKKSSREFDGDKKLDEKRPAPEKGKIADIPPLPANLVIVTLTRPFDRTRVAQSILGDSARKTHEGKSYLVATKKEDRRALYFVNEKTYLLATQASDMPRLLDGQSRPRLQGPLDQAVELAMKKHQMVLGLNLTEATALAEKKRLERAWDSYWRNEPVWVLMPLLRMISATAAVDLNQDCRAQLRLAFANGKQAAEAEAASKDVLALFRLFVLEGVGQQLVNDAADMVDLPEAKTMHNALFASLCFKQAETFVRRAKVDLRQATLQVQSQVPFDVDALRTQARTMVDDLRKDDAVPLARMKRLRTESSNNLKQIMLAMHSHNDVYKSMPPAAICSKKDGKPLLSWRVAILPFIEQQPLYLEFKLDEPWDSPHNIKLLPSMPKTYAPVGVKTKQPYTTFYQVVVGPGTAFEFIPDKASPWGARGIRLSEIADGTSNTMGVVEAFEPVPWTKPADLTYADKKPLPRFGGVLFKDGFHAALTDGSVHFFKPAKAGVSPIEASRRGETSEETLRNAILRADGHTPGPDWAP